MTIIRNEDGSYTAVAKTCNGVTQATAPERGDAIDLLLSLLEDTSC